MSNQATFNRCGRCNTPIPPLDPDLEAGVFRDLISRLNRYCDTCIAALELEDQNARQAEQAGADRKALIDRQRASEIPPALRNIHLDTLDHKPAAIEAAAGWVKNGGGLLFTGDVGRGKTTLAAAAAWLMLERRQVSWTTAPRLFARLGSALGSDERKQALRILSSSTALVLDDIDKARPTEYAAEQVFLAIDHRITSLAPLLVTSNLSPARIAAHWPEPYGPAIASRLVGYCNVIHIDGPDRRLTTPLSLERTAE